MMMKSDEDPTLRLLRAANIATWICTGAVVALMVVGVVSLIKGC